MRPLTKFEDSVLIKIYDGSNISTPEDAFLTGVNAGIAIERKRIEDLIKKS